MFSSLAHPPALSQLWSAPYPATAAFAAPRRLTKPRTVPGTPRPRPAAEPSGDPAAVAALTQSVAALGDVESQGADDDIAVEDPRLPSIPPGGTGILTDQEGSSQFRRKRCCTVRCG